MSNKYVSAIPEPGVSPESLRDAVMALKANVELLTGQNPKVSGLAYASADALAAAVAAIPTAEGFLEVAENLADLDDVPTARTNLGLGTSALTSTLQVLHVQDEKASGVGGGSFSAGAWRTRDLNTVKVNQISGASLATNQVTLPAGTYFAQWSAPGYIIDRHQTKLRNVTDSTDLGMGASHFGYSVAPDFVSSDSSGSTYFVLAGTKVLELQHRCETGSAGGFGVDSGFTTNNVYGRLTIWKLPT